MTKQESNIGIDRLINLTKSSQFYEAKSLAYELLQKEEIQQNAESLANVNNILGNVYWNLSEYPKALKYYEIALQINEEISDNEGIGRQYGNIGSVYNSLSNYPKALEYYEKALQISEEIGNKDGIAVNVGNIGNVYNKLSDYVKSLEYLSKALIINEEIGDKNRIAITLGNIGNVYKSLSNYPLALEYFQKSLYHHNENKYKSGIAYQLGNIGTIYSILSDYIKALEYYEKALQIQEEIGNQIGISTNLGNIGIVYYKIADYQNALEYFNRALYINERITDKGKIAINLGNIGIVYKSLADYPKALEYLIRACSLSKEIGTINTTKDFLNELSELYEQMGDIDNAFSYYKQCISVKEEIQSEEAINKSLIFDQRRKIEEDEKARQLKLARFQEQEKILHNILPSKIADRILNQETFIADHFHSVSVLFMDLVGFTSLSSIAPPKQLVYILDAIFQKADDVVEQYGLEKIKTIGDGYLAVANVTSPLENHQQSTAKAALQLLETMRDLTVNIPSDLGDTDWIKDMKEIEIRIGIHSGEVVAGIIGKNKYTYDLWGDAVNVASRMESNSEAGRIHISEEFAKSIEHHPEFSIISRGEISVKGKGSMNTYWLENAR